MTGKSRYKSWPTAHGGGAKPIFNPNSITMSNKSSRKSSGIVKMINGFIHKLTQRPDVYPIKFYRKNKRLKYYWHSS